MGTFLEKVVVAVQGISGKFKQTMGGVVQRIRDFRQGAKESTRAMKGFKVEMLGIMFFGQMLQRTFTGLLNPVMEAYGVFDLFREMLLILFLPVMDMLFPVLLKVFDFFTNLPEPVKKVLGVFTLIGAGVGALLSLFGSLSLGLGALGIEFPALAAVFKIAWRGITGLFSTTVGVIIAIIIGMIVAWKENFAGMRDWVTVFVSSIKNTFKGLFDILAGLVGFFVGLFKGDFNGAFASLKRMIGGFNTFMKGIVTAIYSAVVSIGIGVLRVFKWIIDTLIGFFKWLWKVLVGASIIPDIVEAIIMWFKKLPSAIWDVLTTIAGRAFDFGVNFVKNIISGIKSIGSSIGDTIGGFLGGVGSFAKNIIPGVSKFNDFIIRPGQAPVAFSPQDTVVGMKRGAQGMGGGGVNINQTLNINVSNTEQIRRQIDEANRRTVEDVRRLIRT